MGPLGRLGRFEEQKCLLIYGVFKEQTTKKYLDLEHYIHVCVPANLTHKVTFKYGTQEDIQKRTCLSRMKPIHAR